MTDVTPRGEPVDLRALQRTAVLVKAAELVRHAKIFPPFGSDVFRLPWREFDDTPRCHFWNRWVHRRQRKADRMFLLPALWKNARNRMTAARAFDTHCKGERHWNCQCFRDEINAIVNETIKRWADA